MPTTADATLAALDDASRQLTRDYSRNGRYRIGDTAHRWAEAALSAPEDVLGPWLERQRTRSGVVEAVCAAARVLATDATDDLHATRLHEKLARWAPDTVLHIVGDAEEASQLHLATTAPGRTARTSLRLYAPVNGTSLLQLRQDAGSIPGGKGDILWQEWTLPAEGDPVATALRLALGQRHVDYRPEQAPRGQRPGPLDRFHPERFFTRHPALLALRPMARNMAARGQPGLTHDNLQAILDAVIPEANEQLGELPLAVRRQLPPLGIAPFSQASSLAAHVLMWVSQGRQIYDLPPALVERFLATDADDVPLSMLRFPYPALYISWSPLQHLELEPEWHVDGAYVESHLGMMEIMLTAAPMDPDQGRWWPAKGSPTTTRASRARPWPWMSGPQ